mmetsp:Transcript_14242/g.57333  ORF Transcript_14242/g.57333 Transcript_14242/m.57333 type:complete len:139 (+) Transcript_14242:2977-3393(+)
MPLKPFESLDTFLQSNEWTINSPTCNIKRGWFRPSPFPIRDLHISFGSPVHLDVVSLLRRLMFGGYRRSLAQHSQVPVSSYQLHDLGRHLRSGAQSRFVLLESPPKYPYEAGLWGPGARISVRGSPLSLVSNPGGRYR